MAIVTDSASNITAAAKMFDDRVLKLPCAAHRLNLCAHDIFNERKIKTKITKEGKETYSVKAFDTDGTLLQLFIKLLNLNCIFILVCYKIKGKLALTPIHANQKVEIEKVNQSKVSIANVIKKCKNVVSSFKHSEDLTSVLRGNQKKMNYKYKTKLVQDCPTRWSSTYDMLDAICNNKAALNLIFQAENSPIDSKNVLTNDEFDLIDEICNLLVPLKEITVKLSASNYVSISSLLPDIHDLVNYKIYNIKLKHAELIPIQSELVRCLKGRFAYLLNDSKFYGITMLDYRYRNLEFIQDTTKRAEKRTLGTAFLVDYFNSRISLAKDTNSQNGRQPLSQASTNQMTNQSSNISNINRTDSSSLINNRVRNNKENDASSKRLWDKQIINNTPSVSAIEIELIDYLQEPVQIDDSNKTDAETLGPFFFYKYNPKYKNIINLAKALLSIPATSVPSESLFSQSGIIQNDLRSRLNPITLENCVLIKENKI